MEKTDKKPTKDRVKEKAAAVKAKAKSVKGRMKAAAKCAVAFALLLVFAGCATSDPASRQTYATYNIKFDFGDNAKDVNIRNTLGDGAIASADSAGSTESITASPTNDVKPDTNIDVPINKASGAQSVGSVLGDAVVSAVKGAFGKDGTTAAATPAAAADSAQKSATCTDGSCTDGSCADGSCTPK